MHNSYQWFLQRFRTDQFSGLPLTLLLVFGIGFSLILSDLTEDVVNQESVVQLDLFIAQTFAAHRTHGLVEFFLIFTFLGQSLLAFVGVLLTIAGLMWTRLQIWIAPFLLSTVTSLVLTYTGKEIISRPRPLDPLYMPQTFSFPSGHSTVAVSVYGFIGLIFLLEARRRSTKIMVAIATLVVVSFIQFSRMVLGVHYLSDVVAGMLVGLISVTLGIGLYLWKREQTLSKNPKADPIKSRYPKILFLLFIFSMAWMAYEYFGEANFYQDQLS